MNLEPVDGVPELLGRIETPVCVASSGEHEKMRLTLGFTGLLGHFDGRMFSATEVPRTAGMTAPGYKGRGNDTELAAAGARVFRDMAGLPDLLDRLTERKGT